MAGPHRRARRALQGKACRRHPALCACPGRGVASPPPGCGVAPQPTCEACGCRRGARRAIHATGQGVPPPPGESRRCRHRCRSVPPLAHSLSAHFHAAGRPTSLRVVHSRKHHLRLYCQHFHDTSFMGHGCTVSWFLVLTLVPDLIMDMIEWDHSP